MHTLDNLYLPGLAPDGGPRTLVNVPGFWGGQSADQARGGPGDFYLPEVQRANMDRAGVSALVQIDQIDVRSGKVVRRILTHNVLTDIGAQNLLKALYTANQSLGQYFILDTNAATAQVNATLTANATATTTAITVVSGGNPGAVTGNKASNFKNNATANISGIPITLIGGAPTTPGTAICMETASNGLVNAVVTAAGAGYGSAPTAFAPNYLGGSGAVMGTVTLSGGTLSTVPVTTAGTAYTALGGSADPITGGGIVVSYGTANADYCSGETASASTGTSIALLNGVTWAHGHAINDWVVANPQTGDGPTSLPGTAVIFNSVASTNGATGTSTLATVSGTGQGSRQAVWTAVNFNNSSTPGSYNTLWIANVSTIAAISAASNFYNHLSFSPLTLNNANAIAVTYTIKI